MRWCARPESAKPHSNVYFKSKEDLFAAVVAALDDYFTAPLIAAENTRQGVRAKLLRFGHAVLELLLAPETVSSYRMVVAEAARSPELGRLETFFAQAMANGTLRRAHPRRAAEQFIGLVRGDLQLGALLGVNKKISERQRSAIVSAGIDTFCRAYLLEREGNSP